jgi:iron(III) transport system ATP-binding protein
MAEVEIRQLTLERPGFCLGPLDITTPHRGRLAVIGPSGAGKTTLLRCLAGFERPDGGAIQIDGKQVYAERICLTPDQRGIGVVFQDGSLWPHLTAIQHLRFAAPKIRDDEAERLLGRAGIGHLRDRRPATMSGGEAQRLGLVRALSAKPSVLLLDEPLRSVDVHRRDDLVLLLREMTDELGVTTILVTHDRDEALALATDLVVLDQGKVVESGAAATLLVEPRTAFTAAFLAGAACLPTQRITSRQRQTPFGPMDHAEQADDVRLVLMPGDVSAAAQEPGSAATAVSGKVLSSRPTAAGIQTRVAVGDQIVTAAAHELLTPDTHVALSLQREPRLLPWHPSPEAR